MSWFLEQSLSLLTRLNTRWFLVLVCSVGLLLRLGFTYYYRGGLDQPPTYERCTDDGLQFDLLARNLAAGKGYVWNTGEATSFRSPGFPFQLAIVYWLSGGSLLAAHLSFAMLGAVGIVGTYLFARELVSGATSEPFARYAAMFATLYPADIYMASNFLSEIPFVPSLAFGLWLVLRGLRTHSLWCIFVAGLLFGYANLCRSFAVLLLPLLTLYVLFVGGGRRWSASLLFVIGFSSVIGLWTWRNYQAHGYFVLIASNGGSTLYGANNDLVAGSLKQHGNWVATNHLPGRDLIESQPNEILHDRMEYKLGVDWIKAHPLAFGKLAVFKIIRLWLPFIQWPSFKINPIPSIGFSLPFVSVTLIGLLWSLLSMARIRQFAICHLTLLATMITTVIFWGDPRFRDANLPILAVYGVIGTNYLVNLTLAWRDGTTIGQLSGRMTEPSGLSVVGQKQLPIDQ